LVLGISQAKKKALSRAGPVMKMLHSSSESEYSQAIGTSMPGPSV